MSVNPEQGNTKMAIINEAKANEAAAIEQTKGVALSQMLELRARIVNDAGNTDEGLRNWQGRQFIFGDETTGKFDIRFKGYFMELEPEEIESTFVPNVEIRKFDETDSFWRIWDDPVDRICRFNLPRHREDITKIDSGTYARLQNAAAYFDQSVNGFLAGINEAFDQSVVPVLAPQVA